MATTIIRRRTQHYGSAKSNLQRRSRRRSNQQWDPWENHPTSPLTVEYYKVAGVQVTESENHQWPPPSGGFAGDIGGDFFSSRQHGTITKGPDDLKTHTDIASGTFDKREHMFGPVWCPIQLTSGKPSWPTFLHSSTEDLGAKGATAVAQCKPTNASSDLLVALGELVTEGIPAVTGSRTWQSRTLSARNAGSEYLNKEFGWDPLISDVISFGDTIRNSDKIMSQYERDMGNLVRRRRNLPLESTRTSTILDVAKLPDGIRVTDPGPEDTWTPGVWTKETYTSRRSWFSGAFCYGIPLNSTGRDGVASLAAEADKLFGLSLTPDVLWELTPWSWAIDWFSNTGDVLSNLSDVVTQGLVMHYGYIMEHTLHIHTYSLEGCTYGGVPIRVPQAQLVSETKKRVRANPFGFGVSWESLSPFQLSILAAIGITRS